MVNTTVGFLQFKPELGKVKDNVERVRGIIEQAGILPRYLVLPELFSTGYAIMDAKLLMELAEDTVEGGLAVRTLRGLARKYRIYISFGIAERHKGKLYNSAVLVGPGGLIGVYRKLHLFYKENLIYTRGDMGLPVFTTGKGIRVGMIVCFDYFFPESIRTLALKGAHIILHPSNLVMPYCQTFTRVRSAENRVFVVCANRTGSEMLEGEELNFTGMSQVTSPKGDVILSVDRTFEGIEVVDISIDEAIHKSINPFNDIMKMRRTDVYFT